MTAYGHDDGPALPGALRRVTEEDLQVIPLLPEVTYGEARSRQIAKAAFRKQHMKGAMALLGAAWGPLRITPELLDRVVNQVFHGASRLPLEAAEGVMGALLIREVCGSDEVDWTIEEAHEVLQAALG